MAIGALFNNKQALTIGVGIGTRILIGAISFAILTLSFSKTSSAAFVAYNSIILCASLVTIFSMPLMESIWQRKNYSAYRSYGLLALVAVLASGMVLGPGVLFVSSVLYAIGRVNERIVYNSLISLGRPIVGLGASLGFSVLEMVFLFASVTVKSGLNETLARFLIPYIILSAIFLAVLLVVHRAYRRDLGREGDTNESRVPARHSMSTYLVMFVTLCVVLATIGDRWFVTHVGEATETVARYLFAFGLASIVLVFFTSIIDMIRPSVFTIVKAGGGGRALLASSGIRLFLLSTAGAFAFIVLGWLLVHAGVGAQLTGGVQTGLLALLSLGYLLYAATSLIQMIMYAGNQHVRLASIWALAIVAKAPVVGLAILRGELLPWFPIGFCVPAVVFLIAYAASQRARPEDAHAS